MPEIPVAGFALEALGAIALALMLSSLDRERHGPGVRDWALGQWTQVAALLAGIGLSRLPADGTLRLLARPPAVTLAYWAPAFVLLGTWARFLPARARASRVGVLAGLAALSLVTSLVDPLAGPAALFFRSGLRPLITAAAYAGAGGLLLHATHGKARFGPRVLALSFLGSALENAIFAGLVAAASLSQPLPARADVLIQLELLLLFLSGVGMVAWLLEDEREAALRLQAALRRREALSEMGTLVAGVAHEVRNPLFALSATVDALARASGGPESAHTSQMREQVARLSRLMSDLLDYGRPIASKLVPGSLAAVAARAVALNAAHSEAAGVAVELCCDPATPEVGLDEPRFAQVIQNLVQNAVEHTPRGGRVRVAIGPAPHDGVAGASCSVSDSGPGFRPETLARAFEPFFSRRPGGTGLGLSIVRRIVNQHGGEVSAANTGEGGGASVRVWLPATGLVPGGRVVAG